MRADQKENCATHIAPCPCSRWAAHKPLQTLTSYIATGVVSRVGLFAIVAAAMRVPSLLGARTIAVADGKGESPNDCYRPDCCQPA